MLEDPGIDPGTSHMQSERSTTWANPPDIQLYLKFNFRIVFNIKNWKIRVSIPVPLTCKASALPPELIPHTCLTI